jgi:hypothetical protein
MIRICVICEGPTEVDFVNRCLEPYLRPSGVSVYGTVLSARSGRHRGGRVTVDRLAHKISLHYGEADRVSTLVDFYGFQDRAGRTRAQLEADIAAAARAITTGYDPAMCGPMCRCMNSRACCSPTPQTLNGQKTAGAKT